jgi:hypothetical protein
MAVTKRRILMLVIFMQQPDKLALVQALPPCNTLRLSILLLSRAEKISIQQLPRKAMCSDLRNALPATHN